MTFKEFKEWFSHIEKFIEESDKVDKALDMIFPNSFVVAELGSALLDAYVELLASKMGKDKEWLFWYIFDLQMGKEVGECSIGETDFEVKSLEDLYTVLITDVDFKEP